MKIQFKQVAMTVLLSSSLLISGLPALADGTASAAVAAPLAAYDLNSSLHVSVEGVFNEKTSSGVRLGAVIRVNNTSDQTVRIPDHELRLATSDGTVYTLRPSSGNAHGVQPNSEVELTYMKVINRQTEVSLTDLSLVDVNYDVYPKQETTLFTVPVGATSWNGSRSTFQDTALIKAWGDTFAIPTLESALTYKPVDISRSNTNQGAAYLVKLLVENPSEQTETVPALQLDGKSKTNVYTGKQVEASGVTLEPGEKKYIHFAINAEMDTVLESLNVLTPETFTQADASGKTTTSSFSVGKLNIQLPGGKPAAASYKYGDPIAFEKWNSVINQDLNVSLVELHVADNHDQGNKLAIAKFKLNNKGQSPVPVPAFQTEITSPTGYDYAGERQKDAQQSVAPGSSVVVSYAFVLPASETSDTFAMKLQDVVTGAADGGTAPTYKSTIASYKVTAQGNEDSHKIGLYPYTVDIKGSSLTQTWAVGSANKFTYRLWLSLGIEQDSNVLVGKDFSKLKFELVDGSGSSLGTQSFPLTGTGRLVSGDQKLFFTNITTDQNENNVSVKVYESIDTPTGEVDRLITELK